MKDTRGWPYVAIAIAAMILVLAFASCSPQYGCQQTWGKVGYGPGGWRKGVHY
jgi:hypothetical protein